MHKKTTSNMIKKIQGSQYKNLKIIILKIEGIQNEWAHNLDVWHNAFHRDKVYITGWR